MKLSEEGGEREEVSVSFVWIRERRAVGINTSNTETLVMGDIAWEEGGWSIGR
jgi:hypothetical protein